MVKKPLATTPPPVQTSSRLATLDFLRGAVMVLMVLDHAWYFFSADKVYPLAESELPNVSVAAFFTSWLPTFCAPIFLAVVGIGSYLQRDKSQNTSALSWFLVTRGIWLILLDVTIVPRLQHFGGGVLMTLILWGIGWSMIGLSALVWLPSRYVGMIGALLLVSQNLLDLRDPLVVSNPTLWYRGLWIFFRTPGYWDATTQQFFMTSSVSPQLGLMAVGYAAGELWRLKTEARRTWLITGGICFLFAFAILRLSGLYGDPHPWQASEFNFKLRCLSFLNTNNLPPSLQFSLLTLGTMQLGLAVIESAATRLDKNWLTTLGRVPLLFYLVQWLWLHLLAIGLALALGRPTAWLFAGFDNRIFRPAGWTENDGYPLLVVYGMWLLTVALAYPLCAWFAHIKREYRWWWLRYL